MHEERDTPCCRARVIPHLEAGRMLPRDIVTLEALNGAAVIYALSAAGFVEGDIVEIRLVERSEARR